MEVKIKDLKPAILEQADKLLTKYGVELENLTRDEEPRHGGLMKGRTKAIKGDGELELKVVVRVPYAETIHEGLPIGKMPPFEPLRFWLEKKLGVPEERMYPAVKGLQKKLKNKGPNANPFATRAVKRFKQKFGVS